jgi:hypothetical protein
MNQGFSIQGAVSQVLTQLGQGAVAFAPRLITALILTLIGWLIAALCRTALSQLFHRIGADAALERAGLMDSFRRLGVAEPMRRVVPGMLFWLAMLIFLQSAAEMVGLVAISAGITGFFAFLPNLFSALVIVVLGNAFGQFLGKAVGNYARDSGLAFARSLGSAVSSFTLFVVAIVALGQLHVDTRILNILTIVVFSGLALAFGLTFGLGTRDTTRHMIAGFYARRIFGAGQRVEIAGQTGTLRAITSIQTLLDAEGKTIAVPNGTFLDQVVRRDETSPTP